MKKIFFLAILLVTALSSVAQEVTAKWDNDMRYNSKYNGFGLYNERTGRWVNDLRFDHIYYLGVYKGYHYWNVVTKDTKQCGVICSKDFGHYWVTPQFDHINSNSYTFSSLPFLIVKKQADYGLMEVGTRECYYIHKCQYKGIYPDAGGFTLDSWKGGRVYLKIESLKLQYDALLKNVAEKKEREERMKREAAARAQKERELASFTLYAKKYVTPRVNEWQQKGEFEKIAAYQERVTGANREQKIRDWTKEAEYMFIQENESLNPIQGMTLEMYDSENEVFSIRSPKFGQLLVPVPIDEGAAFKQNFDKVELRDPVYFISNDKIALKSLAFYNPAANKTYYYNNQLALNYKQYEIDADALDIAPVRISSSTTVAPPSSQVIKPTCEILSPARGSTYSTPTVHLRYRVQADPTTTYTVKFLVAGQEVFPIPQDAPKGTKTKGVQVVEGTDVELPMPQDLGRETAVSIQVVDAYGTWAEPKSITLKYEGEKPKPTLHILSIGVSDYPASDLQNLNYAAKDAQDFVQTITTSDLSMYKEVKPTLITNSEATTANLRRQLTQLTSRVAQGDVVMLFFSGHGINQNKERYFMTVNASAEEYYNGLDFNFIRERMTDMAESKLCRVIVFMDACHSGAMFGAKGSVKDITFAAPGIIGFYSSTASEQSQETDKLQNGVFTRVLLNGLKGGAMDKDGQVTIHQLDSYVKQQVSAQTKGKQTPIVENATGDAVLFHIKKK